MDLDQIRALKEELAKDLEALDRVEAMMQRTQSTSNGNGSKPPVSTQAIPVPAPAAARTPPVATPALSTTADRAAGANTGLQELVLEIVREARGGLRANEVMSLLRKRGYNFRTQGNAASATFSALKRLVGAGRVSKRNMKYYIVEQRELLHSAS